ncbi:alpha/beta hydrolase [Streptomyces klenkii]|uniref:alpha/beta hydrolase n=1 Tax=Streptomyces klenkii TaxID=1420899 RepID=UPI003421D1B5
MRFLLVNRRLRQGVLTACVLTAVCVPMSVVAHSAVPAPEAAALPPLSAGTVEGRYAANRLAITEAADMADASHHSRRAQALRAMADPGRRFVYFDARRGQAAEVLGDLAAADRIAVMVPGSDTSLDTYNARSSAPYSNLSGGARALYEQLRQQAPSERVAVVTWLGYTTPKAISASVLTTDRADGAAHDLQRFVSSLRQVNPAAGVALLGHSYGSVVCARAAYGLDVADIVLYGSPGTGADSVAGLRTTAQVWAGRSSGDWISGVPHVRIHLGDAVVGFGADPVAASFGARDFAAGRGGHSDYLMPGSTSLRNLACITLGQYRNVTHD